MNTLASAGLKMTAASVLAGVLAAAAGPAPEVPGVSGAFIQFDRESVGRTVDQWGALLDRMKTAGLSTVIVQWTAETPVLYFQDPDLDYPERWDVLERLLAAAEGREMVFFLGLQADAAFWREITARPKALRDYFLVRQARQERLQAALLKAFGQRKDWAGYYIPDEIDDLSWRDPARRAILKDYLRGVVRALKQRDPGRPVAVSAFFRTRTAPDVLAAILAELAGDAGLDCLLLQDGAGHRDPPADVLTLYYQSLFKCWRGPAELWAVLEAFRQTSGPEETFAAQPAAPDDFGRQIQAANEFRRRLLFSFPDYVDPELGPEARALYQSLLTR